MSAVAVERRATRLGLLVGSNPLPNYIAAVILDPDEVVLIYSPQTCGPRKHLATSLRKRNRTLKISSQCIHDPTGPRRIRDACSRLDLDHLHFSGGTKPMSAYALQACSLEDGQVSYLDERKRLLRFSDGVDIPLNERTLGLTLDLLLELHDVKRKPGTDACAQTDADVDAVAAAVLGNPSLASELWCRCRPEQQRRALSINKARRNPWKPEDLGLSLSVPVIPDPQWTNTIYEKWDDFLTGGWLERWTARCISACLDTMTPRVDVSVSCVREDGREFEIDVAVVRGHRLHVISCTTAAKVAMCKGKLFEVAIRARQMGGDLTRSALVSFLDRDEERSSIEDVRSDIKAVWDAPNTPFVFGLADLRDWAGTHAPANLHSLKAWLDS